MRPNIYLRGSRLAAAAAVVAVLGASVSHAQNPPAAGAGLRAEFTYLEGPLPVTDTAVNAAFKLTAASPVTVAGWAAQLVMQKTQAGSEAKEIVLAQDSDQKNSLTFPVTLKPGQVQEVQFLFLMDVKIPAALQQLGYADARAALKDPNVKLVARANVRVRGASAPTVAQAVIKLIP